jgi:hypothetical protein
VRCFFYLIINLFFLSCFSPKKFLTENGFFQKYPTVRKIEMPDKEVYFVFMKHLEIPEFYTNTQIVVDSFQNEGFMVFYEGIKLSFDINGNFDTLINKVNILKSRKILGVSGAFYAESSDYIKKISKKYNLVSQPTNFPVCKDTSRCKNIDASLAEMINKCEKKFGEIVLNECDYKTKLNQEYTCGVVDKKISSYYFNFLAKTYRDKLVSEAVQNSTKKKIVIVYGQGHYDSIKKILE